MINQTYTYDDTCPYCGYLIDVTDLNWTGKSYIETDCINCEGDIWVQADTHFIIGKAAEQDE